MSQQRDFDSNQLRRISLSELVHLLMTINGSTLFGPSLIIQLTYKHHQSSIRLLNGLWADHSTDRTNETSVHAADQPASAKCLSPASPWNHPREN